MKPPLTPIERQYRDNSAMVRHARVDVFAETAQDMDQHDLSPDERMRQMATVFGHMMGFHHTL